MDPGRRLALFATVCVIEFDACMVADMYELTSQLGEASP